MASVSSEDYSDNVMCSEQALWLAVINQALKDAGRPTPTLERRDAREWLSQESRDLHIACAFAGIEMDYLLRLVRVLAEREGWFEATSRRRCTPAAAAPAPAITEMAACAL